jgi:hypothetical protein
VLAAGQAGQSVNDTIDTLRLLAGYGVHFLAVSQGLGTEDGNPMPWCMMTLMAALALPAFGAIAYDNTAYLSYVGSNSWTSGAFTVGSGANRILFVGATVYGGANTNITGITYNGVAMTKIASATHTGCADLWYLVNPSPGSHTFYVTASGSLMYPDFYAASYTGAAQTGQPDVHVNDTTSTAAAGSPGINTTPALTTTADNDWLISIIEVYGQSATTGGNSTTRGTNGYDSLFVDRGPMTPAGSSTLTWATSGAGGAAVVSITAAFKPAAASPIYRRRSYGQ